MTRGELLTNALAVFANATDKRANAQKWLNDGLRSLESFGKWRFLETDGVLTFTYNDDDIAFTEAKWGAAGASALTNYSKGMKVFRSDFGLLREFANRDEFDNARGTGASGLPTNFYVGNDILFIFPLPTLTPGTGKYSYFKQISVPANDSDDLFTVCNLKPKHQVYLISYLRYRLFEETQINRAMEEYGKWHQGTIEMFAEEGVGAAAAVSANASGG